MTEGGFIVPNMVYDTRDPIPDVRNDPVPEPAYPDPPADPGDAPPNPDADDGTETHEED